MRYPILAVTLLAALLTFISCTFEPAETADLPVAHDNLRAIPEPDSPDQKRVLAILGDPWHALAYTRQAVLGSLIEDGWQAVTVIDYNVPWDQLSDFDMVVLSRHGLDNVQIFLNGGTGIANRDDWIFWLTAEDEEKLVEYVEGGGKVFFFHDGIGHYKCGNGISRLAKACFITHPPAVEITISPTGLMPELAEGMAPFSVVEEEYELIMDESETSVFLESHSPEHGRFAQGWAHPFGEGKVGVIIPGHGDTVASHPMVQRAIQNMLGWLLG